MYLQKLNIINAPTNKLGTIICSIMVFLFTMLPILFFSLGGSTTRIAIPLYIICLTALIFNRQPSPNDPKKPVVYWWIIFSLLSYLLATGISQLVNNSFTPNRLDAPLRLALSGLIFYAVFRYKINFTKLLKFSIPLGISLLFIQLAFMPEQIKLGTEMWHGRLALPFIDPILLSAWLTCFGLLSLSFVKIQLNTVGVLKNLIFTITLATATYIALLTDSRTSWLAVPILILILTINQEGTYKKIGFLLASSLLILYLINHLSSSMARIDLGLLEIKSYFNGSSKETSVGIRIDMGMLAFKAMSLRPFFGWSENLFFTPNIANFLANHYTPQTLFLAKNTGFHNDFYAAIVRSGSLGAFAYVCTFFTPLLLFIHFLFKGNSYSKSTCFSGLAIIVTCIIASMTVEVISYKYSVSLFGYLIAGIMGQTLWENEEINKT
jgi:O-antigen ligase